MSVKYVLFDAANTLIYKPTLWENMLMVLHKHHIEISLDILQQRHKLLSEVIDFPDTTSRDFYRYFNSELLLTLGVIPTSALLDDIFSACNYLPWAKFSDTAILPDLGRPIGVLSNFNKGLPNLLVSLFGRIFSDIIVSEDLQIRKPDIAFYEAAVEVIGLAPESILYIGDSLKLDIIPAQEIGFKTALIDRLQLFTAYRNAIPQLDYIKELI